jgi:hypothetical protein
MLLTPDRVLIRIVLAIHLFLETRTPMPTETRAPEDLRISDETARLVLERAIQLDAQRPGDTTLAELQRVAQELNVSSGALMEAIRELQTKAVAPTSAAPVTAPVPEAAAPSRTRGWWRTVAIGLGSFFFAAINANDTRDPGPTMLLLLFASIALVLMHRRNRTPRIFQRELLALFAGVASGWIVSGGASAESVVYGSTFTWLAASTIGGWITRFRNRPSPESATDDRQP